MARITGKNGQVKVGAVVVASIRAWSVDAKVPVVDATVMGDQFKVNLSVIREWSGSIEGVFESAGANLAFWTAFESATVDGGPTSGKITVDLYPDAGATEKYSGDCYADFSLKTGHDKAQEFSAKITGTGALTRTP